MSGFKPGSTLAPPAGAMTPDNKPTAPGLVEALIEAITQCELHNRSAGHITSPERLNRWRAALSQPVPSASIDMVLHCPKCGKQHIDGPAPWSHPVVARRWDNPPHRSHLCHNCGHIWRPADVPTNGVAAVKTKGKEDSPIAVPSAPGCTRPDDDARPLFTGPMHGRPLAWLNTRGTDPVSNEFRHRSAQHRSGWPIPLFATLPASPEPATQGAAEHPAEVAMERVSRLASWLAHNLSEKEWRKVRLSNAWANFEYDIRQHNNRLGRPFMPDVASPAPEPATQGAAKPVHTDHPFQHWDRTCPACVLEASPPVPEPLTPAAGMSEPPVCPHCSKPAFAWPESAIRRGRHVVGGVVVYHCREAAVDD